MKNRIQNQVNTRDYVQNKTKQRSQLLGYTMYRIMKKFSWPCGITPKSVLVALYTGIQLPNIKTCNFSKHCNPRSEIWSRAFNKTRIWLALIVYFLLSHQKKDDTPLCALVIHLALLHFCLVISCFHVNMNMNMSKLRTKTMLFLSLSTIASSRGPCSL